MVWLVSKLSESNILILDSVSVYLIWILISNVWWWNFQLESLGYQSFVLQVKTLATDVYFGLTTRRNARVACGHLSKYRPGETTTIPSNKLILIDIGCPDYQNLKNLNCDVTFNFGIWWFSESYHIDYIEVLARNIQIWPTYLQAYGPTNLQI